MMAVCRWKAQHMQPSIAQDQASAKAHQEPLQVGDANCLCGTAVQSCFPLVPRPASIQEPLLIFCVCFFHRFSEQRELHRLTTDVSKQVR